MQNLIFSEGMLVTGILLISLSNRPRSQNIQWLVWLLAAYEVLVIQGLC